MKKFLVLIMLLASCTSNKEATVTAKDGVDGKDGASIIGPKGERGESGSSIVGPKGDKGDRGEIGATGVGTQGPAGAAGKNSVIKTYTATLTQCPNGGLVIDTFTDMNGNNTYDLGDTNYQRSLLCNSVVTITTVETEDEHHEKYHHNHKHDKSKDKDCESGKLDN